MSMFRSDDRLASPTGEVAENPEPERKAITDMTDRELVEEILTHARNLEAVLISFSNHPMARMMTGNGKR